MTEPSTDFVIDVLPETFERDVLTRSHGKPVVVDFWAPWCGPCRTLGPMLEKLVRDRKGDVVLAKVNIDLAQNLAIEFGVEVVPTVRAFRDGRIVLGFEGVLPEEHLKAFLDQLGPTPADNLASKARDLETSNPAEAVAIYRQALEKDPRHVPSQVGLARVLIGLDKLDEAKRLLEEAAPGGDERAEVERLTALIALRERSRDLGAEAAIRRRLEKQPEDGQLLFELGCVLATDGRYAEALDLLIKAAEKDRKLAAGPVKETMVQIFHILGVRSAMADEYRDKLSRLLY
jgi:putative thioredoxin